MDSQGACVTAKAVTACEQACFQRVCRSACQRASDFCCRAELATPLGMGPGDKSRSAELSPCMLQLHHVEMLRLNIQARVSA